MASFCENFDELFAGNGVHVIIISWVGEGWKTSLGVALLGFPDHLRSCNLLCIYAYILYALY